MDMELLAEWGLQSSHFEDPKVERIYVGPSGYVLRTISDFLLFKHKSCHIADFKPKRIESYSVCFWFFVGIYHQKEKGAILVIFFSCTPSILFLSLFK